MRSWVSGVGRHESTELLSDNRYPRPNPGEGLPAVLRGGVRARSFSVKDELNKLDPRVREDDEGLLTQDARYVMDVKYARYVIS